MRKRAAIIAVIGAAATGFFGFLIYLFWLPDVSTLLLENPKTTAYVQLYVRRTLSRGKKPIVMMKWTPLHEISPHLKNAVIIAEDDQFYKHQGVDWEALRAAMEYNRKLGRFARGGSTITQQVARNLYLSPARNPARKLKEMLLAMKLERVLTKYRILEIYLNIAEWGVGIYGVQAASQIYFGKNASELSVEEAVALAAALPSPWRLNPSRESGPNLSKRKETLVERMRRAGYLPEEVQETEIDVPMDLPELQPPPSPEPAVLPGAP